MSAVFLSNHIEVEKEFDSEVKDIFKDKSTLINFFLKHERKKNVIENIQREIKIAEWRVGHLVDSVTRKQIVKTVVKMFCELALKKKEQDIMSDNEKTRLISQADYIKNLEEEAEYEEKEAEKQLTQTKVYMNKEGK